MFPRLSLLALALLAQPRASAPPGPEPSASRCEATRSWLRDRLARHQACQADLDCVPWEPALMACQGWVSRTARPEEPLSLELESACAGLPARDGPCPPAVGACLAGRCAGRPPRRSGDCAAARRALAARVAEMDACEENADCTAPLLPGADEPVAAARAWPDLAAAELREVEEACAAPVADPVTAAERVPRDAFPVCQRRRCRLLADTPSAARWRKPALASAACVSSALRELPGLAGVTVRFTVGKSGRAFDVQVEPPKTPEEVQRVVRAAITGCRWRPGATASENPARIELVLPLGR